MWHPPDCNRVCLYVTMLPPQEPRSPGGHHHPDTGTRPGGAERLQPRLAAARTPRPTPTQVSVLLLPINYQARPTMSGGRPAPAWPLCRLGVAHMTDRPVQCSALSHHVSPAQPGGGCHPNTVLKQRMVSK